MIRLAASVLLLVSLNSYSAEDREKVVLATVSYHLSKDEVAKYSQEAMAGSPDAANKLVNFYWMRGIPDRNKTKYWALIGAADGDAESQFRAYQTLKVSTDRLDRVRALFWLKRAAAQDYLGADAILKSCPDVSTPPDEHGTPCFGPGSE